MLNSVTRDDRTKLYFGAGIAASVVALFVNPVIDTVSPLSFVSGLFVAVAAPATCGFVALFAGVRLYQQGTRRTGGMLFLLGVLATVVGIAYGTSLVF